MIQEHNRILEEVAHLQFADMLLVDAASQLCRTLAPASSRVLFASEDAPSHVNGYLVLSRHVECLLRSYYDRPLYLCFQIIFVFVNWYLFLPCHVKLLLRWHYDQPKTKTMTMTMTCGMPSEFTLWLTPPFKYGFIEKILSLMMVVGHTWSLQASEHSSSK